MADDFAWYVIGTNSAASGDWLSITLAEAPWAAPPRAEDLLGLLIEDLSPEEQAAWAAFDSANEACETVGNAFAAEWFAKRDEDVTASPVDLDAVAAELDKARTPELATLEETRERVLAEVKVAFSAEHAERLVAILAMKAAGRAAGEPPRLELRQLQRYILRRVFDLGWTTERFGHFDRFSIGYEGRHASKAERIGKKYQWIAYHEILALVSDRFQYRERFREEDGDKAYEGPWQDHLRDIDPSCTLRSTKGGTSWEGHAAAWWGQLQFDAWGDAGNERTWVARTDDLPKAEDLLCVTNPTDGQPWSNVQGHFSWRQRAPADRGSTDVERGELWYLFTGYLIRQDDADAFLKWAEGVDFWGRWMPDPATNYRIFLGEHAWAPASRYFERQYYGDDGWTQPHHGCPKIRTAALEYLREASGFDCSVDESYTLRLPVRELVDELGIRWTGSGADFVDATGRLVAQDPTAHAEGPSALLLRTDLLQEFLRREGLMLCWAVLGGKRILSPAFGSGPYHPALRMSGAYMLSDGDPVGFIKYVLNDSSTNSHGEEADALSIRRTPSK